MKLENGINIDTIMEAVKKAPDMNELKAAIIKDAEAGVDFGCECYYCGATPIDLVERGDAIPMMYGDGKQVKIYCFRCSDEAANGFKCRFIKDPTKQDECFKTFNPQGLPAWISDWFGLKGDKEESEEIPAGFDQTAKHTHMWTTRFIYIDCHNDSTNGVECKCGAKLDEDDVEEILNLPACQIIIAEYLGDNNA